MDKISRDKIKIEFGDDISIDINEKDLINNISLSSKNGIKLISKYF